jgi:pullulanase-type alpha-1,6-glucosidase
MGLRLVMDVVYNHTNAAGQSSKSVLDRIVPGYYHRLNDRGAIETSTCCANTASEHNMMEKLMIDSLVTWARDYKVDAFRFDLMGHHMKRNMEAVRAALDALTPANAGVNGDSIYVYGEGWNFGEVANNARGVNATQLNMAGTGIGTFNDRLRDAVRGGGPFDGGQDLIRRQGFANGLFYDPNALNSGSPGELDTLLLVTDGIRVGMAGNLADYSFIDRNGNLVTGAEVDYNGSPTGYTQDPQEDITYVSKHDNQTLFDNHVFKAPTATTTAARVRLQNVALSTVLLGQGVPFLHAGVDLLRSKSLDRDSYNSGDWFNRLDFTYQDNNFGVGLPVAEKNQDNWPIMAPLLADPTLLPLPEDIALSSALMRELLQIRYSSPLFRLQTKQAIIDRLTYHNTGPAQIPGLIVMSLSDDDASMDRATQRIVTLFNANDEPVDFALPGSAGAAFRLHPVQAESADALVRSASFNDAAGVFAVPGRTTAVFLQPRPVEDQIALLQEDVQTLLENGDLQRWEARYLQQMLNQLSKMLEKGNTTAAEKFVRNFIRRVEQLQRRGRLGDEQAEELLAAARAILDSL